jgi:mannose-6-phosphate isomerase-like protein (cupin superfamily)
VAAEPLNERLTFGGITIEVLATAATTDGAMTAIVEIPPLLDTPAHVHTNEDELFVAIEGEYVITRGDEEIGIGPGQALFAPPGVPHAQRRGVEGEGRLMFVCTPGGIESFFLELAQTEADGRLGPEAYGAASKRHGISWL